MNDRTSAISLLVTLIGLWLVNGIAEARPKFPKVFEATYEKEYAGKAVSLKSCTICHDKINGKYLPNNYGDALTESLKQKNVKEDELIRAALKDVEGKPSAIEGKTFGDLIKDGRLPASK